MSSELDITKSVNPVVVTHFYYSSSSSDMDFLDESVSHSDEADRFEFEHPGQKADFRKMGRQHFVRRHCNQTEVNFDDDFRAFFVKNSISLLVISALSTIVNLFLVFVIAQLLRKKLVPRKSYLLLLNLCLIDSIISATVLCYSANNVKTCTRRQGGDEGPFIDSMHKSLAPVMKQALMTATVAAPALGYVCLCVFEWIAIRYPIYYATKVTKRKTVQAIVITWVIAIVVISALSTLHTMAFMKMVEFDEHGKPGGRHHGNTSRVSRKLEKMTPDANSGVQQKKFHSNNSEFEMVAILSENRTDGLEYYLPTGRRGPPKNRRPPRLQIEEVQERHAFFNNLFMTYHTSEMVFNCVCLVTVILCYLLVIRVVQRRPTKIRFVRGLRMHFILFITTTTICIIANCLNIYFTDFMNHHGPKRHKPHGIPAASGSSSMDSDELNHEEIVAQCANIVKHREMKDLLFGSLVAGYLSLTRLLVDACIYLFNNPAIRQYICGTPKAKTQRSASDSDINSSSYNSNSTKSGQSAAISINMK